MTEISGLQSLRYLLSCSWRQSFLTLVLNWFHNPLVSCEPPFRRHTVQGTISSPDNSSGNYTKQIRQMWKLTLFLCYTQILWFIHLDSTIKFLLFNVIPDWLIQETFQAFRKCFIISMLPPSPLSNLNEAFLWKVAGIKMDTNSIQVLVIYSLDSSSAFFCDIMESISGRGWTTVSLGSFRTPFWIRVILILSTIKFRDIKSWAYGVGKSLEKFFFPFYSDI